MSEEEPPTKKAKTMNMNMDHCLTKECQAKSFHELSTLPIHSFKGIASWSDDVALKLKLKTIGDLGRWKFYKWARAFVLLATEEVEDHRDETSVLNANKALDKAHEGKSLKAIIKLPPSALQGLAESADELLGAFHIDSIEALGNWKIAHLASAIVELAELETSSIEEHK
mmetsp:Transcript_22430/g.29064  ORF Transcript_22430/g.29064 Transcript_22430/m.29064 type:complete len:170 (-) Transcript_22430:1429-1938(-)|eukprot:CAMPEP_0197295312 /NCGR_PEP_ID=MMETSP0890-20130614/35216_1 /TAXON_ID=44058 ORGANISM="Aureoumbra lagunensis, Strain CCMP1510" /NCGR_SAMPLE_ID=MMETSP0890 /ASSEMBLY_ACC=CAM_ASM_000533 /LENGTH=169 /DNA_ID=CAMNT_0042771225 /DNA_START=41 /DNA_END=550 /DNA_ORIENTATION=+